MNWLRNLYRTTKWTGRILMDRAWRPGLARGAANEKGILNSDGTRVYYMVQGAGEPVVLIHGYGVTASINWKLPGILPALARNYRVVALDVRGHGRSDKPHDPAEYGVNMADDVLRMLDHLNIETAHVIGYSMGGFILLKLAVEHPERIRMRSAWWQWRYPRELAPVGVE